MFERAGAAILLVVQLVALWWFRSGDLTRWRPFAGLANSAGPRRRYWRGCVKDLLVFALLPLVGLTLLGRLETVMHMPAQFVPLASRLPPLGMEAFPDLALGGTIGFVISTVAVVFVARVVRSRRRFGTLGNIGALLPRGPRDLGAAAALAITAGVTEELALRLYLPLLLAIVTGSAMVAFVVSALIFGALHWYQGWVGVIATTAAAGLLTAIYLMSGLLWAAMAFHVGIDLNGLVLRPMVTGRWREE